jgi:hypothetical protein
MIYPAIVLAILIFVLRAWSPKRYAVHASSAIKPTTPTPVCDYWLLGGLLRDKNGQLIDVDKKFVGYAVGDSMAPFGISAGATFVADPVGKDKKATALSLREGAVVVVYGPHKGSPIGYRLRRVNSVSPDGEMSFLLNGSGKQHRPRQADELRAIVTHVVNPEGVAPGFLVSKIAQKLSEAPKHPAHA